MSSHPGIVCLNLDLTKCDIPALVHWRRYIGARLTEML